MPSRFKGENAKRNIKLNAINLSYKLGGCQERYCKLKVEKNYVKYS